MTCATARMLMLTGDPAELQGSMGSDLALHIATCAACRARATLLLEAQAELARALDDAADHAGHESVRAALAAARQRRDEARRRGWIIPIAAAAVLAGLLVIRYTHSPTTPTRPAAPPVANHGVTVAAPPGRNVAVLRTDNPNVVVIWFF